MRQSTPLSPCNTNRLRSVHGTQSERSVCVRLKDPRKSHLLFMISPLFEVPVCCPQRARCASQSIQTTSPPESCQAEKQKMCKSILMRTIMSDQRVPSARSRVTYICHSCGGKEKGSGVFCVVLRRGGFHFVLSTLRFLSSSFPRRRESSSARAVVESALGGCHSGAQEGRIDGWHTASHRREVGACRGVGCKYSHPGVFTASRRPGADR